MSPGSRLTRMGLLVAAESVVALLVRVLGALARRVRAPRAVAGLLDRLPQALLLGMVAPHALLLELVLDVLGAASLLVGDLVGVDVLAHGFLLCPERRCSIDLV